MPSLKLYWRKPVIKSVTAFRIVEHLDVVEDVLPDSRRRRRQKYLAVEISANATTTELHLLVDSTGIKMLGKGEWKTKKHGADYGRQWRNGHLGIDATTLEIHAIEVTDNATGDAPMLPCLLDQIGANEVIANVSGDGAYDTKGFHPRIRQGDA